MLLYKEYSPSLEKTNKGNLAILRFSKAVDARAKELAKMVNKMRVDGKREVDIEYAIREYQYNNPLPFDILENALDGKNEPGSTNQTAGKGPVNQAQNVSTGIPIGGGYTMENNN